MPENLKNVDNVERNMSLVHEKPLEVLKIVGNMLGKNREGGRTVGSGVVKSIIE